jgi:excisionase family DNA binding protein
VSSVTLLTSNFEKKYIKLMKRGNKLLTIPEVAKRLGISRRTVYRYIKKGKLKAIKISQTPLYQILRISEKDLNQFLKEHKIK